MSTQPPNRQAAGLKLLPKVDKVMALPEVVRLSAELPHWAVLAAVRAEIAQLRAALLQPRTVAAPPLLPPQLDLGRLAQAARQLARPPLRPVLNATGVVLHTNLGRAPLPALAIERLGELGGGYLNLEYRLEAGERGSRQEHLPAMLAQLTGAPACLVVNNNAAAVLLMLAGLCSGREVVVSRGELVEIGGSFRIPDVMRTSGARLREVGTSNRTHLRDYQQAIGSDTAALLKVHRSNFAVVGFTAEVGPAELARAAHQAQLLCLYDLGSGVLAGPLADWATGEPPIEAAIAAGCDLVSFSCDKLLGGPQAGVLCGTAAAIEPLRQHPLLRALRPDKLTLIALAATLELWRDGRQAELPTVAMLLAPPSLLAARAARLAGLCAAAGLPVDILPTESAVGGGALPLGHPASLAVSPRLSGRAARRLEAALRCGDPAVVARLVADRLLCDVRTLADHQLGELARALVAAAATVIT
jgi:L-seryl-tRNA(Ser) seleniumtransferase